MTLLQPTAASVLYSVPSHRVYVRSAWADPWSEVAGLFCSWCFFGCSPEPSRAELDWTYGRGYPPGKTAIDTYDRQDYLGYYVKVEIDQTDSDGDPTDPILWFGIVTEQADMPEGMSEGRVAYGHQKFVCHGLELLLDRVRITQSWYDSGGTLKLCKRALQFNNDHDFRDDALTDTQRAERVFRNRTQYEVTVDGEAFACHAFTDDLAHAEFWSTRDIVDYLFTFYPPKDSGNRLVIPWALTDRAQEVLPTWDRPTVRADGMTIKRILDQLLDRRRLFAWQVIPNPDESGMLLDAFSFNESEITLPGGELQKANSTQTSLNLDTAVDVLSWTFRESESHRVARVVCRGARKRAVFSLSAMDGTLEPAWKADDETAYETGPTGLGADHFTKKQRLQAYRREERFRRVYSWFRVPKDWDFKAGDGLGEVLNPILPDDAETGAETVFLPEARFETHLPPGVMLQAPTDSAEDRLQPAGWSVVGSRWVRLDSLSQSQRTANMVPGAVPLDFSCSLHMQPNGPGIIVTTSGGLKWDREAIASVDFTPIAGVDTTPPLNWRTMIFTVCLEMDDRVSGRWPAKDEYEELEGDVARETVIDFGDKYRLDYVAPGTVKGSIDGVLSRFTDGVYLRDDRKKLEDIARLVYEWYAVPRRAVSIRVRRVEMVFEVGQLITELGGVASARTINSVVTSAHIDLSAGTTAFTTAFGELDPLQY